MYTSINTTNKDNNQVLSILNNNIIKEEKEKAAIEAMGMSACQARCLSCSCCARCSGKGH